MGVLAVSMVGVVVASRYPGNAVGWLFCLSGLAWGVSGLASEWAVYGLVTDPGTLPGGEVAAWLASWLFAVPLFAVTPLTLLLFPDGRPPTPRWRPVKWLVALGLVAVVVGSSLAPGKLAEEPFTGVDNPVGVDGARGITDAAAFVGFSALLVAIVVGMAALVVRFRRARGDERLQLKWFVAAGVLFVLACLSAFATSYSGVDELVLSPGSDFAVAGSTLAAAARTLERFGGRLRDEVDLDAVGAELRGRQQNRSTRPRFAMASIFVTLPGRPRRRKDPGWQE